MGSSYLLLLSSQRQKWPQLLVPFSKLQPLHQSFPPDARCRCFWQNRLRLKKKTMWFKLKKKKGRWNNIDLYILFRIHIYIHIICKLRKKTTTHQRLLLSLGRNLKQKLWDVEIFNWRLNVQSGSTLHTVDGSDIRRSPPGMSKSLQKNGRNYHIQLVQGFLESTVDSTCCCANDVFSTCPWQWQSHPVWLPRRGFLSAHPDAQPEQQTTTIFDGN